MNFNTEILKNEEKIIFGLRELFHRYGYSQFKMSKFEEYDLYARNKDFLVSDNVITFTDTNGKLMALKPDVTLSIVRNSRVRAGTVSKVYYNENVYRVSSGSHTFREIPQVGIECIGDTDAFSISEVLLLAAGSLQMISEEYRLDISDLDIVSDMIKRLDIAPVYTEKILRCAGQKNLHEMEKLCREAGADPDNTQCLRELISLSGSPETVIPRLSGLGCNPAMVRRLRETSGVLASAGFENKINIDFSIVSDMKYYNGIVCKGYVSGIPSAVLSGGQYDNLMKRMGKNCGAIGFAVYLDLLERLDESRGCDADIVLLYSAKDNVSDVLAAVSSLSADGSSVTAQKSVPEKLRYRRLAEFHDGEVKFVE